MYMIVKHAHFTIILLTFVLFIISLLLTLKGSDKVNNKLLKIGPHILYTLFLLTFAYMIGDKMMNSAPLSITWVLSKLGGFVLYVLSITFALKWAKTTLWRVVGMVSVIFWLVMSARLGFAKHLMVKGAGDEATAYIQTIQTIALYLS